MDRTLAAIHVLKARLRLSDENYRALLGGLTGKTSSKDMTPAQRQQVRQHMQRLAGRMGVDTMPTRPPAASPRERKVWALWQQLHRDGVIRDPGESALRAWCKRTVGVDAPRFCNAAQLDTVIEALKAWQRRTPRRPPICASGHQGQPQGLPLRGPAAL